MNRPTDAPKRWRTAFLLSLLIGWTGADRFYLGYAGLGLAKALTLGGWGIWWLIDLFMIATGRMTDFEGRPFVK